MEKLRNSIKDNIDIIKTRTGNSADIVYKTLMVGNYKIGIIYAETMCDSRTVNDFILEYFNNANPDVDKGIIDYLEKNIPIGKAVVIDNFDDLFYNMFAGFVIVLSNDSYHGIALMARAILESTIATAENEVVVKGPKDAFTENYNNNVGMIRRRIKSPDLWLEEFKLGIDSKTKVGIMYMKNIVDDDLVRKIVKKVKETNVDILFGSNYLVQMVDPDGRKSFPNFFTTERPDTVTFNLMDGRIILFLENTQIVMILPAFFFDFFHSSEDYYLTPLNANLTRLLRFIAFFISVFAPAIYIALTTYNQEALPTSLLISFASQRSGIPFPSVFELLLMLLTFEILKETDIRSPNVMGSSLSIVGSLVLGQAAIQAGIVSPIMVIVVSVTIISGLIINSYDASNAMRLWRLVLLFFASIFGLLGVFLGTIIFIVNLTSMKSFGKPFFFPLAPFYASDQTSGFFITNKRKFKKRMSILSKKNPNRQGE